MSFTTPQMLQSLAMGQLMLVAPELGESYTGKTASTIAILTLMAAALQDRMLATAPALRARLEALLADADVKGASLPETDGPDAALAARIAAACSDDAGGSWFARQDVLLAALEELHAWADANDPALAGRCRAFLVALAEAEMVEMPVLPG